MRTAIIMTGRRELRWASNVEENPISGACWTTKWCYY